MPFSKELIEKLAKEYLDTLDHDHDQEWWCTEKVVAEEFVNKFVKFLVEKKV